MKALLVTKCGCSKLMDIDERSERLILPLQIRIRLDYHNKDVYAYPNRDNYPETREFELKEAIERDVYLYVER